MPPSRRRTRSLDRSPRDFFNGLLGTPRRVWLGLALLILLLPPTLLGCTATVTPPRDVKDGVELYLIREAMHRGLVFPLRNGFVEFGFGEEAWYAQRREAWYRVPAVIFAPTPGTYGRRSYLAQDLAGLRASRRGAEYVPFVVERARAEELRQRLQAQFDARAEPPLWRGDLGMHFVPAERDYWWLNDCIDVCVAWLEDLGCHVSWVPLMLELELESER
jgi:hypothetical protein